MAYLSDDDEQKKQAAQGGGGFDINAKVSGGGGGDSGASSDASQQNAVGYEQSFGGGGSSSTAPKAGGSSNSAGLGSATPGGGFVNFQSFENANPSSAGNIANAGRSLVSSEKGNIDKSLNVDPASGFSFSIDGAPGSNTGGKPGGFSALIDSSGDDWPKNKDILSHWMGETYTAPPTDYMPSEQWKTDAPELSQKGIFGSLQNSPSVVDYLARPNIKAGNYSSGERSLDQAIIGGDAGAQQAIANNAKDFAGLQLDAGNKLSGLLTQEKTDAGIAAQIKQSMADIISGLDSRNDAAAGKVNSANADLEAKKLAEAKAYLDWYNGKGYTSGNFTTTNTPGTNASIDPKIANEMNNLADLEGKPEPYPNYSGIASAGTPGSYAFDINASTAPVLNEYGGPADLPLSGTNQARGGLDPSTIQQYENAQPEQGAAPMSQTQLDEAVGKVSTQDLQSIYKLWMDQMKLIPTTDTAGRAKDQRAIDDIAKEIQSREQSPTSLVAGLGLTPADLAALGL